MDTETKLVATLAQAIELRRLLDEAIEEAKHGNLNWVRVELEQVKYDGPWRLILGVQGAD